MGISNTSKTKTSLQQKLAMLKHYNKPGSLIQKTAEHFKVSKGVVQYAKKQALALECMEKDNFNLSISRVKGQSEVNVLLYRWFCLSCQAGFPITGPLLKEKALVNSSFVESEQNFHASDGWLDCCKKKHQIEFKSICGESAVVDKGIEAEWKLYLPSMCEDYTPANIFNMDKTLFFCRTMPDKMLAQKGYQCEGGKVAKDRLTLVVACSSVGEKLQPLVSGKSKTPWCFRNVDIAAIGCMYQNSQKAWMTNWLFNEWLMLLNKQVMIEKKILVFIDNVPVHINDKETEVKLTNVEVKFFPPKMTSILQPLNASII